MLQFVTNMSTMVTFQQEVVKKTTFKKKINGQFNRVIHPPWRSRRDRQRVGGRPPGPVKLGQFTFGLLPVIDSYR